MRCGAMSLVLMAVALLCISFVRSLPTNAEKDVDEERFAGVCEESACKLPDCRCSRKTIPSDLNVADTPQFVMLTFDDGVTVSNFPYYQKALLGRTNSDSCPVAATFYVSHEYTDYSMVNELYAQGHEIALHSITHNVSTMYWRFADAEQYALEFAGQRKMMSHFANIPIEGINGIRVPFLQINGNTSYEMMAKEGFTYDCTMPSQRDVSPGLWPYTLDYQSTQDCVIGPCPSKSLPGVWVIPMLTWSDNNGVKCAMVDTCVNIPDDVDGILAFMIRNFEQSYKTNKAPFGFYVHAAWFQSNPVHFEAYLKFLDYLQDLNDVFIVKSMDVINWIKNPQPVSEMRTSDWSNCRQPSPPECDKRVCVLTKGTEQRFMTACVSSCPQTYPWLNNPLGD